MTSAAPIAQRGRRRPKLVRLLFTTTAIVALVSGGGAGWRGEAQTYNTTPRTGDFVALSPQRLFDTRSGTAAPGPKGFVPAGSSIDVQITGTAGVPAQAFAVALNLTATDAAAPGFVTIWPTGQPRPLASNLNVIAAGQTVSNFAVVRLGTGGQVSIFASGGAELLADIEAAFVPFPATRRACDGFYTPVMPIRVLDTRPSQAATRGPKGFVGAGQSVDAAVGSMVANATDGLVPQGARAAVVTITGTEAASPGYLTVHPAGQPRPTASVLNLERAGHTAANLAIVPIGTDGRITLYSSGGAHIIVDLLGYFDGTFVSGGLVCPTSGPLAIPDAPYRIMDTRPGETPPAPVAMGKGLVAPGSTVTYLFFGTAPTGPISPVNSVFGNLTAVDAAPGFATTWNGTPPRPNISALNVTMPGEVRASAFVSRTAGLNGSVFFEGGGHLVVDVLGYIPGAGPIICDTRCGEPNVRA